MAKFLTTTGTNYHLEELIKGASDRLILISPFPRKQWGHASNKQLRQQGQVLPFALKPLICRDGKTSSH